MGKQWRATIFLSGQHLFSALEAKYTKHFTESTNPLSGASVGRPLVGHSSIACIVLWLSIAAVE